MRIGLALSGGGSRAVAFHLGVLRRLAKGGLLEQVSRISTVSGGSIAAGLVYASRGLRWPTSQEYLNDVYPGLERLLTTTDLLSVSVLLSTPSRWPKALVARADLVAFLLRSRWGLTGAMRDVASAPEWVINTTCIETGKNWRFSPAHMGDWVFGHHFAPEIEIAKAVAASAAVPYVIGALTLPLPEDGWYEIDPATDLARARKRRLVPEVRLWDGGVYENLGLEALFKPDRGLIGCECVIVSDASAPVSLQTGNHGQRGWLVNLPSPRLFDIASDQIRSLRSRMFVQALREKRVQGALIRMGASIRDIDLQVGRQRSVAEYDRFQSDSDAATALKHPTNLARLLPEAFRKIARHGFEDAGATLAVHCDTLAPSEVLWDLAAEKKVA